MKFKVIGTGSSGNAFLIDDNIIIDCGLSFKKLNEACDLSKIKWILLSHKHSDHYNKATIRQVIVKNKHLKILCGNFLLDDLLQSGVERHRIEVVLPCKLFKTDEYTFSPVSLYHDVPNFGWRILNKGKKHFHATDTEHLNGISAYNYDSASIETNHCEIRAKEIIEQKKESGEFCHLVGTLNSHLSVQQTVKFVRNNNIKELIPIHVGDLTKDKVKEYLVKTFQ